MIIEKMEVEMSNLENSYCDYLGNDLVRINSNLKKIGEMKFSETIFAIMLFATACISIWKAISLVISLVNHIN